MDRLLAMISTQAGAQQLSLVGCTGILVHNGHDFNLQVPANADVSRDSDHGVLVGDKTYVNDDLRREFSERVEILTQAGYDVELTRSRCVAETGWLVEYGDVVDPSSIDMTLGGGDDDEGWGYGWRKRNRGADPAHPQ